MRKGTRRSLFRGFSRVVTMAREAGCRTDGVTIWYRLYPFDDSFIRVACGQIIDVTPSLYTVQLAGTSDKLDAFLASLRDVARIVEVARSGVVGLSRGDKIMR